MLDLLDFFGIGGGRAGWIVSAAILVLVVIGSAFSAAVGGILMVIERLKRPPGLGAPAMGEGACKYCTPTGGVHEPGCPFRVVV